MSENKTLKTPVTRGVGHGLVGENGLKGRDRDAFGDQLQRLGERSSAHAESVSKRAAAIKTERVSRERKAELRGDLANDSFREGATIYAPAVDYCVTGLERARKRFVIRPLTADDLGLRLGEGAAGSESTFNGVDVALRIEAARQSFKRLEGPERVLQVKRAFGATSVPPNRLNCYALTTLAPLDAERIEEEVGQSLDSLLAILWSRLKPTEHALIESWTAFAVQVHFNGVTLQRSLEASVGVPSDPSAQFAIARVLRRLSDAVGVRVPELPTGDEIATRAKGKAS